MSNIFGRQVIVLLTNKSGGGVIAGDVVVPDGTNDSAFTTTTSAAAISPVWVAQETIASNATGRVLIGGWAGLVNVNASVTRGHYGATHTVAKQAADAGASRTAGTFCRFLTGGTTPIAYVFPTDLLGSSLTNPMANKGELIQGDTAGTPAALAVGTLNYYLASGGAGAFNLWRALPISLAATNTVATDQTLTGNNSFVDLTTAGPAVTVTTGTLALVTVSAEISFSNNAGAYGAMSFAVSGATTIAAARASSLIGASGATATGTQEVKASYTALVTLTAGSNTFTAKYSQVGGAGTTHWANRDIVVVPLN